MMFARLDDLEGQVEDARLPARPTRRTPEQVDVDAIVLVRGRVDHKEAGEVKLIVQEVEAFAPSHEEVQMAASRLRWPPWCGAHPRGRAGYRTASSRT